MEKAGVVLGIVCIGLAVAGVVANTTVAAVVSDRQSIIFLHGFLQSIAFGVAGIGLLLIPTAVKNLKW